MPKAGPPIQNGRGPNLRLRDRERRARTRDTCARTAHRSTIITIPAHRSFPGMVDCHTHNNGFGDGRNGEDLAALEDEILTVQAAGNARRSLFSGVTTIRENGPKNMTMFRLRDAINEGLAIGPRMMLCGRPVSIIGGHMGYFGGEVTGVDQCRGIHSTVDQGRRRTTSKSPLPAAARRPSFPLRPAFNVDELLAVTDEAAQIRNVDGYT